MSDPKSTNDIRLIAQDVVHQQSEVCAARRDNLADKLASISTTVSANATAIGALTQAVAALTATTSAISETQDRHDAKIGVIKGSVAKLQGRPAAWAAIGAALPTLLGVLLWWFSK